MNDYWITNITLGVVTATGWFMDGVVEYVPEVVTVVGGLSVIVYNVVQTYYKILENKKKGK